MAVPWVLVPFYRIRPGLPNAGLEPAPGDAAGDTTTIIMVELREALFTNPVWHALHGPHRHLTIVEGDACRYPADIAPFAAIAAPNKQALDELRALLASGESVWIVDHGTTTAGLSVVEALDCVQTALPQEAETPPESGRVQALTASDANEIVRLTEAASGQTAN